MCKKLIPIISIFIICYMITLPAFSMNKEIKIAVGLALPPYVIQESNSGMELDIVREVLNNQGYTMIPKYVRYARVPRALSGGKVRGAITILEASGVKNVHYSDSHIMYQNVAISLKKNNYAIAQISDLSNKKIVAFQQATRYLGAEFLEITKTCPAYEEKARQQAQILRLFKNRTQVIVLDINIFKYYRENTKGIDSSQAVSIHEIFPKTRYKVAFVDSKIRDAFNIGLKQLKENGEYEGIMHKYIKN